MSDSNHLYIPHVHRRDRPPSPSPASREFEEGLNIFNFMDDNNSNPVSLLSIDQANGLRLDANDPSAAAAATAAAPQQQPPPPQPTMPTVEEQLAEFRRIAEQQQAQLQQYEQQQRDQMAAFAQSQQTVAQLSQALATLTANTAATPAQPPPQRKRPEMPPWDPKRINVWIRRLTAAYQRAGVVLAKDKFAFLESTFEVNSNPKINEFLYGTNTDDDWDNFLDFLRQEFGTTIRQRAQLLIKEYPRQGLKPSQYLSQMNEDTQGVEIDHIKREQLLKSLPSRVRELLGKEVENMTSQQVATKADSYFDREGNLLERHHSSVNMVNQHSSSNSFTPAFSDDDADDSVNHIRSRGAAAAGGRPNRSKSRVNGNKKPQNGGRQRSASSFTKIVDGECGYHRKFGDQSYKCVDGCKKQSSMKTAGNGKGGRRQ